MYKVIIKFIEAKIKTNKSEVIHRSLINLIPIVAEADKSGVYEEERFFGFMKYLKNATGEDRILAQSAIRTIINRIPESFETKEVIKELRSIVEEILASLKEKVEKKMFLDKKGVVVVKILNEIFLKIKK